MKKIFILIIIIVTISFSSIAQNVGIGTNVPKDFAKLDISSTTSGLQIPRMKTAEKLTLDGNISALSAALSESYNGMIIYDITDKTLYVWDQAQATNGAFINILDANSADDMDWTINANNTGLEASPAGNNVASGTHAIASGFNTDATGDYSTATGYYTEASGLRSTAMGHYTDATGDYSTAIGRNTVANGYASTVVGVYNDTLVSTQTYINNATPLFIVGNGGSISSLSNAFVVKSNGDVEINEEYTLPNKDGTANQVLTTDGAGAVSWAPAAGGDADWDINANNTGLEAHAAGDNIANGAYSIAAGLSNTAQSYGESVSGLYATEGSGNATSYVATDRLFTIGNGTSILARSDAFTVLKNGAITINEEYTLPNTDGAANNVLKTNGAGQVSWSSIPTGTDNQNLTLGAGTTSNSILQIENGSDITLQAGTNVTLTESGNTLTINSIGDKDWYEASTNTAPDNIYDNIYTYNNVGIGKNSPAYPLDIYSSNNATMKIGGRATTYQGPALLLEIANSNYGERYVSSIYFNRMRENVEWSVGTEGKSWGNPPAYPVSGNDKFYIARNKKTTNTHARIRPIYETWRNGTFFVIDSMGRTGIGLINPTYKLDLPNNSSTSIGRARAYAWHTYSDKRLKSEITNINYGLKTIMQLKPSTYIQHNSQILAPNENRAQHEILIDKNNGAKQIGFIAQELYEIIPESVIKPESEDTDFWSVDYSRIIPVLTKAIQEQQVIIQNQQIESDSLKGINKELEERLENIDKLLMKK